MNAETKELLDEILSKVELTTKDWIKEQKENVEENIRRILDLRKDATICRIVGFEFDRFDQDWRVDHCNGRAGQSMIGDWFREQALAEVKQWLSNQVQELPTLSKSAISSLKRSYQECYEIELERNLKDHATKQAREEAARIISTYMNGD